MQYLLLIYSDEKRWEHLSEEERGPRLQEWFAYTDELREAGALVAGDALQPTSTATTVQYKEGETLTTDGPFAETKEQLGGYYLLECGSIEEALEWAAKVPAANTGSVEVRQVMDYEAAGFPNPAKEAARSA
jgi:hypothetical protein